ncbi:MAG TPA: type II toxin-antitoxin system ParD family antitoxin [Bacteroidia bacterium]|nr:type II toxin-antitoxin system ParD family antitoxin [Bacteroidia bacterium]
MNVSLTPELERLVREKVESGLYDNADEVVHEALHRAFRSGDVEEWLLREAELGYRQLQSGNTVRVRSKEEFKALVRSGR